MSDTGSNHGSFKLSYNKKEKTIMIVLCVVFIGVMVCGGYWYGSSKCKQNQYIPRDPYDDDIHCEYLIQKSREINCDLSDNWRASRQGQNYGNTLIPANSAYAMNGDFYDTGSNGPQISPKKDSTEEEEIQI